MLVALASVAVATTLLPVILDSLETSLEWPRKRPAHTVSPLWTQIAARVVKHRIIATIASLAILGALIAPVFSMHLGEPQARATAITAPADAHAGYEQIVQSGLGAGILRPTEILYHDATPVQRLDRAHISAIAPSSWRAGPDGIADAWTPADASTAAGARALSLIRAALAGQPHTRVGGTLAEDQDFIHALYGPRLLIIVAVIVVLTFLLLARALRSIWLPIKALVLNALSLAAALGVVTFLWQQGHLTHTLFASPATGAVTLWVPLAVFSLLFGLSMDYEVFILTRFSEEYEADHDINAATVRAIGRTGRLVSSGALILCLAFIALGGVPQTDVKILSTGLAVGIIVDATIIRGILAPALLALLGHYNWTMPDLLARLLRIQRRAGPERGQ
jgi:RND superfamily putative drug exporter